MDNKIIKQLKGVPGPNIKPSIKMLWREGTNGTLNNDCNMFSNINVGRDIICALEDLYG